MSFSSLLIFCSTYLLLAATPGPGIAALLSRVMGKGSKGIFAFIMGFVIADLFWFTIAVTGLAVVAQTFYTLFVTIKYAGAAYLLFIAYKLWTARPDSSELRLNEESETSLRAFFSGLAITLGNPKVAVFFMALLPTVVDLKNLSIIGYLEIATVICLGLATVLATYTFVAIRARNLISSPQSQRTLNRTSSVVMTGSAVAIAIHSLGCLLLNKWDDSWKDFIPSGRSISA